jgi:hypothetical protein
MLPSAYSCGVGNLIELFRRSIAWPSFPLPTLYHTLRKIMKDILLEVEQLKAVIK